MNNTTVPKEKPWEESTTQKTSPTTPLLAPPNPEQRDQIPKRRRKNFLQLFFDQNEYIFVSIKERNDTDSSKRIEKEKGRQEKSRAGYKQGSRQLPRSTAHTHTETLAHTQPITRNETKVLVLHETRDTHANTTRFRPLSSWEKTCCVCADGSTTYPYTHTHTHEITRGKTPTPISTLSFQEEFD